MKSLRDISAGAITAEIERNPEHYITAFKDEPTDYLKQIFSSKKLSYITLDKFLKSGLYNAAIDSTIIKG